MAVIPAIVSDTDEVDFLLDQIEQHYLSNPDRCLGFALLTDFLDAPQKHMSGDHVLLDRLSRGVRTLNEYYGQQDRGHFYLFHRYRTWNRVEGCWMGWERKRGKLIEFNRLMNGEKTSFDIQIGDLSFLSGIRYVITLDTDTRLPRESARRLIATLAHPLNQAEFDRNQSQFIAGYTILQPRVDIHPASWNHSHFTQIFAVETGLDLYTHAVSNVYQDLFGEGIYIGKGIYEVAPFQRVSDKRIPENTVISHDLLEGLYGRVGLVSDVVFYEDFPLHYLSFVSRLRRWVRGDWQLLPWLFHQIPHAENRRERSPFGMLGRWKIFNNLLHSLHRPALSGLLLAGWLWLPSDAWVWTVIVVLISASEHLYGIFTRSHRGLLGGQNIRLLPLLGNRFWRWIMALLFLPFESWICLNAITSTLIRLFVTRKHLLRWTANAHILSQFGKDIKSKKYWQYMLVGPLFGLGMFWLITFFNPAALITASPLLIAWLISPQIAWWISRPAPYPTLSFSPEDQHLLHKVTRRTWSYFERSIGPQTNWLPLDNLQEAPAPYQVVKTSPTNLGLALLSTMAAADSGYIGPRQLATRLEKAIMSLECLPRHNGHFFNWYDIQKLSPVLPHYVSFVDSGNLAACLLAMKQGLKEVSRRPALNGDRWQGLIDTIAVLTEYVVPYHENRSLMNNISHLQNLARLGRDSTGQLDTCSFRMLEKEWQTISKKLLVLTQDACHDTDGGSLHQITFWVERVDLHLATLWSDVRMLTPWLLALEHSPAFFSKAHANPAIAHTWRAFFAAVSVNSDLEELPAICTHGLKHIEHLSTILSALENPSPEAGVALHWCMNLMKEMQTARKSARKLLHSLQKIRCWAEKTFSEMDFGFLFNSQRKVFSVGYNLDNGRLDLSSYDILASEARLASLIAIAKNDVPQDHWAHMARPFAWLNGEPALLSLGGSLFEYLMPTLLARTIPGSLLDGACRIAISGHIAVGNRKSLPWGLSESSCYPFDASQGYQYCSFGVKELAVNSKLGERQVIAPYATALALPFQPRDALNNLVRLIGLGMLGPYGLYEAIDFTLSPSTSFKQGTIVPIYMTHHQGMVMLSLVNCTQHHVMVHRFHADPRIQTVELLLWEVPIPHRNIKVRARDIKRFKLPLRGSPSNLA